MIKFEHTFDRQDCPLAVVVRGRFLEACRGARGPHGEPEEPDEDAAFDFDSITDLRGQAVDLTDDEMDTLIQIAYEDHRPDQYYDPPEPDYAEPSYHPFMP